MKHTQVTLLLADLAAGRLAGDERSRVEAHVKDCESCASWVATYGLIARYLNVCERSPTHPSSAELAHCATYLDEPCDELEKHLEQCPYCMHELELAREALASARPAGDASEPTAAARSKRSRALPLLAAGLFLGALVGGLVIRGQLFGHPDQVVSVGRLEGQQLITARGSIRAEAVEIAGGSNVVFQAADVVALGDGFVVAENATLVVESGSRSGYWRYWHQHR